LPLMAAAITARVKRWKETALIDHGKVNCLKSSQGKEGKAGRRPGAAGIARRRSSGGQREEEERKGKRGG
jgi:hypothetical protein